MVVSRHVAAGHREGLGTKNTSLLRMGLQLLATLRTSGVWDNRSFSNCTRKGCPDDGNRHRCTAGYHLVTGGVNVVAFKCRVVQVQKNSSKLAIHLPRPKALARAHSKAGWTILR